MRLLILFLLVVVNVAAQLDPVHRKFTTDDGLGSNTIYSFFQMENGRMVVGHDVGISFFNGEKFTNPEYKVSPRSIYQSVTLRDDELLSINFQGKSFRIFKDTLNHFDTTIKVKRMFSFENQIYLITSKELYSFEKGHPIVPMYDLVNLFDVFYSGIIYQNKLYVSGFKDSLIYLAEFQLDAFKLLDYNQISYAPDFFIINDSLLKVDYSSNTIFHENSKVTILSESEKIHFLYSLSNSDILVGTQDGLLVYDAFWNLKNHFFKGISTSKAFQDIEGNIWLGTLNDGLFVIEQIDFLEFVMNDNFGKRKTFSNSLHSNNNIFLSTYKGQLICIDKDYKIIWEIDFSNNSEVQAMYFDKNKNTLLVYCKNLFEIDPSDGRIIKEHIVTSTKSIDVENGIIACGTSQGLALSLNGFNSTDKDLWIRNLYFLNENEMILETQLGIKYWSKEKGLFKELKHPQNIEPENLTYWNDKYVVKYGDSLYQINNYQLIPFEWQPQSIFKLGATQDYLYASHLEGGFSFFDGMKSENYHTHSGLHNFKIKNIHYWNDKWFLFGDKSYRIIPFKKNQKNIAPNLSITKIEGSFVWQNNTWESEYENNLLRIICQLYPNVSDFGEGKVLYRIIGVKEEWMPCNKSSDGNELFLERLPFGNYLLEIKCVNISGNSSNIVRYELIINKPFYLTWWFLGILVFCILIFIYIVIKWREQIIQKKNLEKLKKEKLKIQALKSELAAIRSQMNPHLIFNSLSSIQTKVLSNQSKEAYEHLVIFTKLLRQALDYSQREYITLKEELDFLCHYIKLEFLRKDATFFWDLKVDDTLQLDNFLIPSLILQPFAENAIIHGLMHTEGEKKLFIKVNNNGQNGYEISISDNGIGREASRELNKDRVKEHKSFAMKAIQQRIAMINLSGKLKVSLEIVDLQKGTEVILKVNSNQNPL